MTDSTRIRLHIKRNLERIPPGKLVEVNEFLAGLLALTTVSSPTSGSLEGIWEGLGFEGIDDLDQEVRTVRTEMSEKVSKKLDGWSI